jgi:hypothetical protein
MTHVRRFAAAAGLAMKLEGHPHKQALLEALERRRLGRAEAFLEQFMNELLITGALRLLPRCALLAARPSPAS